MKAVLLILLTSAPLYAKASCGDMTDCGSCVNYEVAWTHACYWCEIDQGCHTVGSVVSACTPELANKDCLSKSSYSHCTGDASQCNSENAKKPMQIHLALAGPQGMRVAWKTNGKPVEASVVFSRDLSAETAGVAGVEKSVQYLEGHGWHHFATLENLTPGERYEYQIVCDGVKSAVKSFQVAGSEKTDATLLFIGDMGYGEAAHAAATRSHLETLRESTDFDMTVHVGDIAYADNAFLHVTDKCATEFCYEAVYDAWMDDMENFTDTKPYMVLVGNHEAECHSPACMASSVLRESLRNFSAYNARWAMPSKESNGLLNMWYSFDYASVHFVVLNTETDFTNAPENEYGGSGNVKTLRSGHFAPEGAYLKWLEEDLRKANENRAQRPWVIALGHRTWWAFDGKPQDDMVRDAHAELFQKYNVDLYMAGHFHSYHRLTPREGNPETPVIVSGGAGCEEFKPDMLVSGEIDETGSNDLWDYRTFVKETQIGTLKVSSSELLWTAISTETGKVFDTVRLTKSELFV